MGLDKVKVLESGTLEGDVAAPRVVIDDGAFFKGNVDMTKKGSGVSNKGGAPPQKGPSGKGGGGNRQGGGGQNRQGGGGQNRQGGKGQNDGNRQGSKVSQ